MAKTISLWSYGEELPSFRHRIKSLILSLEEDGWTVETVVMPSKRYYRRIFERLDIVRRSDVIIISKLKLNPLEMRILRKYAKKIIYDFDDAIYLRRPKKLGQEPGKSFWRTLKFHAMCRHSDLIFAGNKTIAAEASKANNAIQIIPTPVDSTTYDQVKAGEKNGATVVWIGLPGNLVYMEMVREALRNLQEKHPKLSLRIVSSRAPDWQDINVEFIPWSTEGEAAALKSADIGVMPLSDDDWSRGKCAFKLLQYMAAGLPCVGSPVGANKDVVIEGETGFQASTSEEWQAGLDRLLSSQELRENMGTKGRQLIEEKYDRKVVAAMAMKHISALYASS